MATTIYGETIQGFVNGRVGDLYRHSGVHLYAKDEDLTYKAKHNMAVGGVIISLEPTVIGSDTAAYVNIKVGSVVVKRFFINAIDHCPYNINFDAAIHLPKEETLTVEIETATKVNVAAYDLNLSCYRVE